MYIYSPSHCSKTLRKLYIKKQLILFTMRIGSKSYLQIILYENFYFCLMLSHYIKIDKLSVKYCQKMLKKPFFYDGFRRGEL